MPAITTEHGNAGAPLEVELEPETLSALLRPSASVPPSHESAPRANMQQPEMAPVARSSTSSAPTLVGHRWYTARVALSLGTALALALVGVVAYGSLYPNLPKHRPVPPIARSAVAEAPPPAAAPAPAAAPVRYANPFDRSEIFEFPSGTSRADARSAVAVILMDRARSRVRQLPRMATVHRKHGTAS